MLIQKGVEKRPKISPDFIEELLKNLTSNWTEKKFFFGLVLVQLRAKERKWRIEEKREEGEKAPISQSRETAAPSS